MHAINEYGTTEQKERYLPRLAAADLVGSFCLTEPNAGSDIGKMECRAKFDSAAKSYVLNGAKTWITNAPVADIFVIWARCDDGKVRGFVAEKGARGLSTAVIPGKMSLRASSTGSVYMDNLRVPEDSLLPGAVGMAGTRHFFFKNTPTPLVVLSCYYRAVSVVEKKLKNSTPNDRIMGWKNRVSTKCKLFRSISCT